MSITKNRIIDCHDDMVFLWLSDRLPTYTDKVTQEIKKLSIFDLGWVKQQFQRLKDLNAQYQLGQRCWRNDKDYYCDDDKNSRKAV